MDPQCRCVETTPLAFTLPSRDIIGIWGVIGCGGSDAVGTWCKVRDRTEGNEQRRRIVWMRDVLANIYGTEVHIAVDDGSPIAEKARSSSISTQPFTTSSPSPAPSPQKNRPHMIKKGCSQCYLHHYIVLSQFLHYRKHRGDAEINLPSVKMAISC